MADTGPWSVCLYERDGGCQIRSDEERRRCGLQGVIGASGAGREGASEPIFEPTFRDESYGFRPGRSTHMAMRRIWRQLKAGNSWVVDADIADFLEP